MPPPKLTVELVPATSWGDNLRSRLSRADWDRLRHAQYAVANHACEICGGKGRRHPVECHETWAYDDESGVQTLTGLIALCPPCHRVKHLGFAAVQGKLDQAIRHLARVNGWRPVEAQTYAAVVFHIHAERSQRTWVLNLDWLDSVGVTVRV